MLASPLLGVKELVRFTVEKHFCKTTVKISLVHLKARSLGKPASHPV